MAIEADIATIERSSGLPVPVELGGGWAADLVWSGGHVWIAWASCLDAEPDLLAAVARDWPLRPGVTAADWRRRAANIPFTVSLARVDVNDTPETDHASGAGVAEAVRELSRGQHAVEGPALAAVSGHEAPAVLWVERRGRGSVLLAWLNGTNPETVAEAAGAMLAPRAAVDGSGRLCVAWQQWPLADSRWLMADSNARPHLSPSAISHPPSAGGPQIVAAVRDVASGAAGAWSAPVAVSPAGPESGAGGAWAPALAAGPDGTLWCAWDAWDGAAYQIYIRRASAGGAWGETAQVSWPAPGNYRQHFHLAPDVAAAAGRAWVVWSRSPRWGELNHRFNHTRSLHAAVVTAKGDGSLLVAAAPGAPVLSEPGRLPVHSIPFLHSVEEEFINPQAPRVRLDAAGRPVVFYRRFRSAEFKDCGWTIDAVRHTGEDWTAPVQVSGHTGFPDTPYGIVVGAADGESWLLAYHAGEYGRPRDLNDHPSKPVTRHRLVVEAVRLDEAGADGRAAWPEVALATEGAAADDGGGRLAPPAGPATAVVQPVSRSVGTGTREPARDVMVDNQTYMLLYGDLHRHSLYSKCMSANDGDPLDHWRWVQDVEGLDFYALTEHLPYMSYLEWRRIEDLAEALAAGGQVLALRGFELSVPPGHTNFFYCDEAVGHALRIACLTSPDLAAVWRRLDEWLPPGKVVAIRHHQGHRGDDLAATYAPAYEPVVEIIQTRGEYPDWVQSLWRQGFRVGVVGASDHSRGAPFVQALTGLWLPGGPRGQRTREAVLDGLRVRRTFATNGPRMSVFLSATGTASAAGAPALVMGEAGSVAGAPRLTVEAVGTRLLETVAFCRGEQLLHVEQVGTPQASLTYVDGEAPPGEHAYWVRITQERERSGRRPHHGVAYSSPIWITTAL